MRLIMLVFTLGAAAAIGTVWVLRFICKQKSNASKDRRREILMTASGQADTGWAKEKPPDLIVSGPITQGGGNRKTADSLALG
jgi:hypothetical protein